MRLVHNILNGPVTCLDWHKVCDSLKKTTLAQFGSYHTLLDTLQLAIHLAMLELSNLASLVSQLQERKQWILRHKMYEHCSQPKGI